jgi:hypothetical protein
MNLSTTTIRRLLFLIVLLAVALPLMIRVNLTQSASPETKQAFENVDTLQEGSIILVSFDFEASSLPEVKPLAEALLNHAFRKNLRVLGVSLFAEGTALGEQIMRRVAKAYNKVYGADYVYLGFRPQYTAAILGMGESIAGEFPLDYFGTPVENLPLFAHLTNYDQISLVVSIADGSMPTYWAEYAVAPYGARFETLLTATMATAYYPYLSSGQFVGLVAGLKGAAEYELLLGKPGGGKRGLLALSVSQVVMILIIVAGNIADYRRRRE